MDENNVNQSVIRVSDVSKDRKRGSNREEPLSFATEEPQLRRETTGRSARQSAGTVEAKQPEQPVPKLIVTPVPYSESHRAEHAHRRDISMTAPVLNGNDFHAPERPQRAFVYEPGVVEPIQNPVLPTIFFKKNPTIPEVPKEEKKVRGPVIYKNVVAKPEPSRRSTTSQDKFPAEMFENDNKLFAFSD